MKLHLHPRHYFSFLALFLLQFLMIQSFAQTHTQRHVSMISNSWGFWEYLPQNYSSESGTYPLIVFLHGIGELGDGGNDQLSKVLANGTPKLIANGSFPSSFTVNGETFKFIVISPQFLNWPSTPDVQGVIDYAVKNYRVNTSRIYLTGLSMGGGAVWDYAGASADNANRLAAIVPVCGVSGPVDERINVLTKAALPIWATHNLNDPDVSSSNTIGYIDKISALNLLLNPLSLLNLNPIAKKTIFPVGGHDAWSTTYNPTFKENNKNIYEWMLQYTRGNSAPSQPAPPAANQAPTASAGSNQWITLPTSSVVLAGSGKDADGTISNYSWTKTSGPASYNFNFSNVANPTVSNLTEGTYAFKLTVTDNAGATASDEVTIIVSPAAAVVAPPVTSTAAIPGKIEAENYNSMFGVINEKTSDDGGGLDVGWIEYGDWMNYNVNVATAGSYTVNFRVASTTDQQFQLKSSDGSILSTVNVPNTGGFQAWKTVTATVTLKAGAQVLTISSIQNGFWNINWLEFVTVVAPPSGGSSAIGNSYATVPGKIEAENYNAMFGVIAEPTLDANGGQDIGWIENGDWMDYNVNVTASGTYTVNFRVASPYAGQQLQLKSSDGTVLATVSIPQTGGFQTWKTVTASVSLKAGNQTLRVLSTQNGWWNINYLEFVSAAAAAALPGYSSIPGKIESETYTNSYGVITESTTDLGGGQDVGWIELGDWFDYNVYVTAAGNYTVNFRVATPNVNQQLQVKNAAGSVLATVNIPQTGGFQVWRTVSVPLYLFAGNQTIRISSLNGWWNINWMEFITGSLSGSADAATQASGTSSISAIGADIPTADQVFNIYPNPVNKVFSMQLKNNYTGPMNVQIVNLAGAIVKQFKLSKGTSVSQLNLSVGELTKGTYMIKVQIGNWSDTKKMIKL